MRRLGGLYAALVAAVLACAGPAGPDARGPAARVAGAEPATGAPERVLLVTVAGLTSERHAPRPGGGGMPVLAALARGGVAATRVEPVAPPVPYVVHTTLVTGRPADEHGVVADRLLGERGVRTGRAPHASRIRGETLWQRVADAGRGGVAALDWPATRGASIPQLLPDVPATGRDGSWLDRLEGSATTSLLELARERFEGGGGPPPGGERDAFLVEGACRALGGDAPPRLLLLRLRGPGVALQRAGPGSDAAEEAFARADAELGRLVRCLAQAGRLATTAFAVAGDRGLAPVHTLVRPNRLLAEAGLVATTSARVRRWRALARSNGGSAFVYARDAQAAVDARRALAEAAGRTGAFRVVSAQAMLGRNADPEAWFGLDAEPGFVFGSGVRGPVLAPTGLRAAGGYLAEETAPSPSLVLWGAGLRAGLLAPALTQLDVAPTLAALLGVPLPDARGRTLVGLLQASVARGSGAP